MPGLLRRLSGVPVAGGVLPFWVTDQDGPGFAGRSSFLPSRLEP
jgi:hypothetical protein